MASINVDLDFFDHPQTKCLIRLLGRGSEVLPIRLWTYAGKFFPKNGKLTGISAQEIEEECRWWGEAGKMVAAMLESGWLEKDGKTFVVHNWLKRQGHISVYHDRAIKAANAKWDKERARSEVDHAEGAEDPQDDAPGNASGDASSSASSNAIAIHSIAEHSSISAGEVSEADRLAAYAAFDGWSGVARGHKLNEVANEYDPVRRLLSLLAQRPPVLMPNGVAAAQHRLVPQAVNVHQLKGTDFRNVKYACGAVKNLLEEWQSKGMPGQPTRGGASGGSARRPPPPKPEFGRAKIANF